MEAPLLTIEGKDYIFVKTRSHMPVSIHKGDGCYLRIGPPELIQGEIDYHRSLLEFGFPIPTILTTGEHLGYGYFIESSLEKSLHEPALAIVLSLTLNLKSY
jgi:hypothetical protein